MEEDCNLLFEDTDNNDCTILEAGGEYLDVCQEVVIQNIDDHEIASNGETQSGSRMHFTEDEWMVMQQPEEVPFEGEQFIEITTEGVIAEPWKEHGSEIVVGSEEHIEFQPSDEIETSLPTKGDPYAATRPYPCDFCSRRFRKKAKLKDHMVADHYGCNLCGKFYTHKCDLTDHLKIHAYMPETGSLDGKDGQAIEKLNSEEVYKPSKSPLKKGKNKLKIKKGDRNASGSRSYNYVDEDVNLKETMENSSRSDYSNYVPQENNPVTEPKFPVTDSRKPFVCQHCGVGFETKKALVSHVRYHGNDCIFECRWCEDIFWDISLMREHLRINHGVEQSFGEDKFDKNTKYDQFFCPTCGRLFDRQDSMRRHQRIHIKEKITKKSGLCHICSVCGDSFPEPLELLAHADVHARRWKHRCMICGELGVNDEGVANHVQTKNGHNLPQNTCRMCGRKCKDRSTLRKHSFEHSRMKPFGCSECGKTFRIKARLKRHMISHRNKALSCEECSQDFPNGRSLMNHRRIHSSMSGRHFTCSECGEIFASKNSQIIHTRKHTGERPHGCRFCWKAFADGATLRKHERIHTGEKPYACVLCPRAFNQRVVLREHLRSQHSGPDPNYIHSRTPYLCAVCSDQFATPQDLIVHLIHHCDLNTANHRQLQEQPRKYKRRPKLKPHEVETVSSRGNEGDEEDHLCESETDDKHEYKRKIVEKPNTSVVENINSIMNAKPNKRNRKMKSKSQVVPSGPKTIHIQKIRVPVENTSHGVKVCHKARTLVTQTQPTELKLATGERRHPRIKTVSHHALQAKKLPIATFPTKDRFPIASDTTLQNNHHVQSSAIVDAPPDIANEQVVETDMRVPKLVIKVNTINMKNCKKKYYSLKPDQTIIGPGNIEDRVILQKNKKIENPESEPEDITLDIIPEPIANTNQETVINTSRLHKLEELSVQNAHQNIFKCAKCNEVFSDRDQLIVHVRLHF